MKTEKYFYMCVENEKTQLITELLLPKHHDILPYVFQMRITMVILIRGRQ